MEKSVALETMLVQPQVEEQKMQTKSETGKPEALGRIIL